jgi:16S rRNA (guanine966-N2)-methyltransferase
VRIVGGALKGRTLHGPPEHATRPTSDRVREAIFNILLHGLPGFGLAGSRVLDLFAGTGAMGLEALSRGARFCQFVEESPEARAIIRRNAEELGLIGRCKIWRRDATALGPCAPQPPFDLVIADPPYGKALGEAAAAAVVDGGWMAPGGVLVLEESAKSGVSPPPPLHLVDERLYGDTRVMFLRAA